MQSLIQHTPNAPILTRNALFSAPRRRGLEDVFILDCGTIFAGSPLLLDSVLLLYSSISSAKDTDLPVRVERCDEVLLVLLTLPDFCFCGPTSLTLEVRDSS